MNLDERYSRQGQLALAYKFCVKQIMETAEARLGKPVDPVLRECIMVEMQVFFQKAKRLMDGTNPAYEQFFNQIVDLCQSLQTSQTRTGS